MADDRFGPVPDYEAEAWRCRSCEAREIKGAEMAGRDEPSPNAGIKLTVTRNGNR